MIQIQFLVAHISGNIVTSSTYAQRPEVGANCVFMTARTAPDLVVLLKPDDENSATWKNLSNVTERV